MQENREMVKTMARNELDITGKVCPFCLLAVRKAVGPMKPGEELVVRCDHPPAATESIPRLAND